MIIIYILLSFALILMLNNQVLLVADTIRFLNSLPQTTMQILGDLPEAEVA